jgi:hypothetical protein
MAHEAAAAAKAIKANLAARAALVTIVTATIAGSSRAQFYANSAPQDAVVPYTVAQQRSPGTDFNVLHDVRGMSSPLWRVLLWVADDSFSATAQSGAKQIDVALSSLANYPVTDANGDSWIVSSIREGGPVLVEELDKETKRKYYGVGGDYRLHISAA